MRFVENALFPDKTIEYIDFSKYVFFKNEAPPKYNALHGAGAGVLGLGAGDGHRGLGTLVAHVVAGDLRGRSQGSAVLPSVVPATAMLSAFARARGPANGEVARLGTAVAARHVALRPARARFRSGVNARVLGGQER